MIVTLTPNPSIDRAIVIDALHRGEVHRATSSRVDPGGKGVNVSRALAAQGTPTLAVLPAGGPEGHLMEELLDAAGVRPPQRPRRRCPADEHQRARARRHHDQAQRARPRRSARPRSTPCWPPPSRPPTAPTGSSAAAACRPGAPADLYAALVARVRERGIRVAVDSSGTPMTAAVAARPHLVKPNHEELAELVGHPLPTLGDVHAAARDLVADGIEVVAVSLGGDGALLVTADELVHARASITAPLSTVGAGDCMLAGLLHGLSRGLDAADALAGAVTWGAAAVTLPGSRVPAPHDLDGIPVEVTRSPNSSLVLR